ncbi:FACT complex subunit SSRP1 [Dryobates pubescens]|uniref:FACT complex subunit SSRP1 n=1 Tax=Dryobates pubescens TaxID=118200 RepID=A0A093G7C5_DRYPU|nr:FACT complex subunit SSRP1 [Dryobates pubescens]
MADTLEFNEIYQEVKGSMNDGRLRLSRQGVIFKNSKTGKVDNIQASELAEGVWRRVALGHGLKLLTKNGHVYKYDGFRESEFEKLSEFFRAHYRLELAEKDLCVKGWNWGTVRFGGQLLSFDIGEQPVFEIPLSNVSQCTTGKNEVTLEFHQNDDAEVSLMEVRFYVPPTQEDGVDPVEAFAQNVLSKADVIQATGDAICIFRELQCLTPRGRYDIRIYPTFLHLHGKTFDYKIPYTTVLRLFLLPHKDQRQMFFVISLDPPIKQGQTRYHFLILLFSKDEDISLTLNMNEEEVEKRFEGRLTKNMSGSLYEMVSRVMKALVNRKITVPGNFQGTLGGVSKSVAAVPGQGLPSCPGHWWGQVSNPGVSFGPLNVLLRVRGRGGQGRRRPRGAPSPPAPHPPLPPRREEYGKLFDFVNAKKLNIKNRGLKEGMKQSYDEYADSDEDQHDAYLERMKEEGKIREENANDSSDNSGEETDESFNPGEEDDDVAEEFDSNASASSSSGDGDSDRDEKKPAKKAKVVKDRKPRKKQLESKKGKDPNAPKRPMSAYMLWLNANRERIKSDHPGISITDLSKKAGELWKAMSKEKKEEWDRKAEDARRDYEKAMKEYGMGSKSESSRGEKSKKKKKKQEKQVKGKAEKKGSTSKSSSSTKSPAKNSNESFKSKEFVSSDESSSAESKKEDSEEEGVASLPPSSEDSASGSD